MKTLNIVLGVFIIAIIIVAIYYRINMKPISASIPANPVFYTDFTSGSTQFTNYKNSCIVELSPNGSGKSYDISLMENRLLQYNNADINLTTNNITYCASIYSRADQVDYTNIIGMWSPGKIGANLNIFKNKLSYEWPGTYGYETTDTEIKNNQWMHVCLVISTSNIPTPLPQSTPYPTPSSIAIWYINGEERHRRLFNHSSVTFFNNDTTQEILPINIGGRYKDQSSTPVAIQFNGYMTNVGFYSRALSGDEIQQLYKLIIQKQK